MILTPKENTDVRILHKLRTVLNDAGFSEVNLTSPEEHDRIIAFTSQLPHVISNAYVKSTTAVSQKGFSAGSYRDLTRVSKLNEKMWTELFFENKEPLLYEIESIINSLSEYRDALQSGDRNTMKALLRDGRIAKEEIDG